MKQLVQNLGVNFVDNEDPVQFVQNCISHRFTIENPKCYTSGCVTLSGSNTFTLQGINYLFLAGDREFKLIFNTTDILIVQHLSYVNLSNPIDVVFENCSGACDTLVQYLHGKV